MESTVFFFFYYYQNKHLFVQITIISFDRIKNILQTPVYVSKSKLSKLHTNLPIS